MIYSNIIRNILINNSKSMTLESVNTHSVALMPLIKDVLFESNLTLNNIDLFACDKGPRFFYLLSEIYSLTIVKVGLEISFSIPKKERIPSVNLVFPEPKSPNFSY